MKTIVSIFTNNGFNEKSNNYNFRNLKILKLTVVTAIIAKQLFQNCKTTLVTVTIALISFR